MGKQEKVQAKSSLVSKKVNSTQPQSKGITKPKQKEQIAAASQVQKKPQQINTENAKKSIDDLFVKLKKTQKEMKVKEVEEKVKKDQLREARKNIKKEEAQYKTDENGLRYTEEGYRIYTIEELNIGKGGDTKDCPFDCQCCF